jgi:glycerate kinase
VAETAIAQVYALTDLEPDPEICMRDAAALLSRVAERVARDWLVAGGRPGFHSARMET